MTTQHSEKNTMEACDMVDIKINRDVLILGAGALGLETASRIAAQGLRVSVIGRKTACARESGCTDAMLDSGDVTIMQDVTLYDVAGVTGDFRVTLARGPEKTEARFGAVVVAPSHARTPLNAAYGLTLNDRVLSESAFGELISREGGLDNLTRSGDDQDTVVAFLLGFGQEGDTVSTGRILESALAVQNKDNCRAYIYAGNVKVGAKGLERLFTAGRHAGVVCFKPDTIPLVEQDGPRVRISVTDPVLRTAVELEPDYVVVEEGMVVGEENLKNAALLRIDTDIDGFLPSNNVHRFPVRSNRKGIFVVSGPGDAANAALGIQELLGKGTVTVPADQAKVDEDRCVICLTCYRSCPHGAIFWENGAAVISPAACQGCGICAGECPMDAIQIGGFSDDILRAEVEKAVVKDQDSPSIVAFCCKNSAHGAGEAASLFGHALPSGFRMIKVPCAGKVDVEFIMKAFVDGADGVMVAACHEGNCKAERGNIYAKWRVNEIRKRLESMGLDKESLEFVTVASNMAGAFAAKVNAFAEKLR
ncbi:MAG: hydrogenase iron-sulfur subunit [Desulfamplus sp.]|nr:hydrogenase iron-sulfur subunit [Desulfamplus sp.]